MITNWHETEPDQRFVDCTVLLLFHTKIWKISFHLQNVLVQPLNSFGIAVSWRDCMLQNKDKNKTKTQNPLHLDKRFRKQKQQFTHTPHIQSKFRIILMLHSNITKVSYQGSTKSPSAIDARWMTCILAEIHRLSCHNHGVKKWRLERFASMFGIQCSLEPISMHFICCCKFLSQISWLHPFWISVTASVTNRHIRGRMRDNSEIN